MLYSTMQTENKPKRCFYRFANNPDAINCKDKNNKVGKSRYMICDKIYDIKIAKEIIYKKDSSISGPDSSSRSKK